MPTPRARAVHAALVALLTLLAAACAWLATRDAATLMAWGQGLAPDGDLQLLTPPVAALLRRVLAVLAAGCVALAGLAWWQREAVAKALAGFGRALPALGRSLRLDLLRWQRAPRAERLALLAILAVGLALRLHLAATAPMRHDEAKTFYAFISRSLLDAVSNYYVPNNHVFHSVLAQLGVRLFGDGPLGIRAVALAAGWAIVPLTVVLARRYFGRRTALLAGAWAAVSPALVNYSSDARGYTLLTALTVAGFALIVGRERQPAAWLGLALCGALAIWAVPVGLIGLAVVLADRWLAAWPERAALRRRFWQGAAAGLGALLLASLLYVPAIVRSGAEALVANIWVKPLPIGEVARGLPALSARVLVWSKSGSLVQLAFCLALILAALWPKRGVFPARVVPVRAARLALALLGAPLLVLVLRRLLPPERVFLVLLPCLLLLAAHGVWRLWPRGRRHASALALAGLLAGGVAMAFSPNRELEECPEAEALAAAILERASPESLVITATPAAGPLRYHLLRRGFDERRFVWIESPGAGRTSLADREGELFLVIREGSFDLAGLGLPAGAAAERLVDGAYCALYRRPS